MAGDGRRAGSLLRSAAVTLLVLSLAPSSDCFSLRGLSRNVHREELVGDAAGTSGRIGHIVFNGNTVTPSRFSADAADDDRGLAHVDLPQADGADTRGQTSQQETAYEAAWRRLNPTLTCGDTKMKLKATGPGAADLQLDAGALNGITRTLPLVQVPRSCGYSIRRNGLGLILVVPYDGCGVVQENGNYVLPLNWLRNPVKLSCPTLQSADAALPTTADPVTTTSAESPPAAYPPVNPNYPFFPYMYPNNYWPQQWQPSATSALPTTTPQPTTTTPQPTTTAAPVTAPATAQPPAAYPPVNPNYPFFPYMYPNNYWPQQWQPSATSALTTTTPQPTTTAAPVTTTVPPAAAPAVNPLYPTFPYVPYNPPLGWPQPTVAPASTTIAPATNAPATNPPVYNPYPYYQYPYYVWYASDPAATPPPPPPPTTTRATTTTSTTTTTTPMTTSPTTPMPTPPSSLPPNYPNNPYYPAGFPSQPGLYHPFIQPLNPPTECSMQSEESTSTTCPNQLPSSSSYLDWARYYPYSWFPFLQYTWHQDKHFPYSWKYRSPAGYLPGFPTLVQPYPGFSYQQPVPWLSYMGQEVPPGV